MDFFPSNGRYWNYETTLRNIRRFFLTVEKAEYNSCVDISKKKAFPFLSTSNNSALPRIIPTEQ